MLTEDFQFLVKEYGQPCRSLPATPDMIGRIGDRLPSSLIDFWSECGIGIWLDGGFQFCDPTYLQGVVNQILGADHEVGQNVTPYGYTASGNIFAWGNNRGEVDINFVSRKVTTNIPASDREKAIHQKLGSDRLLPIRMMSIDKNIEFFDDDGNPLFERARDTLGPLDRGECYGFVPAIGLGGSYNLKYLKRLEARTHLSIIAQLDTFTWVNVEDGVGKPVRQIRP